VCGVAEHVMRPLVQFLIGGRSQSIHMRQLLTFFRSSRTGSHFSAERSYNSVGSP